MSYLSNFSMRALQINPGLPKDDDEWDDYRENKKDYTGLKIENLTQEQPKEEEEEETEVEQSKNIESGLIIDIQVNEDGEVVAKRKDGKDGPWNKLGDAPSNQVNHIVYIGNRVQYDHHHHHAEFNGGTRGDSGAKAGSCGAARLQQRGRGQLCSTSHEGPGGSNEDRVDQNKIWTQWNHSRDSCQVQHS